MFVLAVALAVVAALLHVYIFVMESLTWTSPRTRATFGLTVEEAQATKEMAFNQGFYNLFLAIVTGVGAVTAFAHYGVGVALLVAGTGSMLAAAAVLLVSSPSKANAAVKQGAFPLLSLLSLAISIL